MSRRDRVKALGRRLWDRLRGPEEEAPVPSAPPSRPAAAAAPAEVRPSLAEPADLWAVRFAVDPQGKPLIVNHWATWCDPCLEEVPALVGLFRRWGDRVPMVGVGWELLMGAELGTGLALVEAAHKEHGMAWKTLVYTGTAEDLIGGLELPAEQIPQTFVFDGDGGRRFWHLGPLGEHEIEEIDRILTDLTAS